MKNASSLWGLRFLLGAMSLVGLFVVGCTPAQMRVPTGDTAGASQTVDPPARLGLSGTSWRLVEFRSMDDSIGSVRPEDPDFYTMSLEEDGRVSMRLNCNRGMGSWKAEPSDGDRGSFLIEGLAVTRALCPPPSLDERIARDSDYVRSYVRADGRLHLSLMADGGIYVWESTDGGANAED